MYYIDLYRQTFGSGICLTIKHEMSRRCMGVCRHHSRRSPIHDRNVRQPRRRRHLYHQKWKINESERSRFQSLLCPTQHRTRTAWLGPGSATKAYLLAERCDPDLRLPVSAPRRWSRQDWSPMEMSLVQGLAAKELDRKTLVPPRVQQGRQLRRRT